LKKCCTNVALNIKYFLKVLIPKNQGIQKIHESWDMPAAKYEGLTPSTSKVIEGWNVKNSKLS
jgi:hypothetical protein